MKESVQRQPSTPTSFTPVRRATLQRKCACGGTPGPAGECTACRKRRLQRERSELTKNGHAAPPSVLETLKRPGHPLPSADRKAMEHRFQHDFSHVRVHSDARAVASAAEVQAQAYTVGQHIVLGREATPSPGRELLAHELAHTLQQGSLSAQSLDTLAVSAPNSMAEREAEAFAQWPTHTEAPRATGSSPTVSRQAAPAAPARPTVTLGNFRNSGSTSADNNCSVCPVTLGPSASNGTNGMELTGTVSGHVAGAQYDIKRTKERATWKKTGGSWTQLTHVGPGADDDSHDSDEDLTPSSSKIYVIDTPGFTSIANPVGDAGATEAVYKASFKEFVNVKVGAGSWARSSNEIEWHSITWLEKSGGSWRRRAGQNEIATGSTTVGSGDP